MASSVGVVVGDGGGGTLRQATTTAMASSRARVLRLCLLKMYTYDLII